MRNNLSAGEATRRVAETRSGDTGPPMGYELTVATLTRTARRSGTVLSRGVGPGVGSARALRSDRSRSSGRAGMETLFYNQAATGGTAHEASPGTTDEGPGRPPPRGPAAAWSRIGRRWCGGRRLGPGGAHRADGRTAQRRSVQHRPKRGPQVRIRPQQRVL